VIQVRHVDFAMIRSITKRPLSTKTREDSHFTRRNMARLSKG
jgi:hypothetical protein